MAAPHANEYDTTYHGPSATPYFLALDSRLSALDYPPMRIGILGGSFDPVHNGHLALARTCQSGAALDEIWFTPAAIQPLKQAGPHASDQERVEMLRLATADEPSWRVCTIEIDRGGVSYTVDTLQQIHTELPDDALHFIMGSDVLADVANWKDPAEIFRLATPLIVARAGEPPRDFSAVARVRDPKNAPRVIEMRSHDVSSSEIRRRIRAGEAIDQLVPVAVADFIAEKQLYR
jgi:nicotinate-nucleotide adenylyltransferase